MTIEETAALVRQMQAGNTDAFDEIFAAYEQKAVRTAALICGEVPLAEDIAQETFVTCLLQIEKLQNPYCFSSWFFKILIRCAWKQTKKKQKLMPAEEILAEGACRRYLTVIPVNSGQCTKSCMPPLTVWGRSSEPH